MSQLTLYNAARPRHRPGPFQPQRGCGFHPKGCSAAATLLRGQFLIMATRRESCLDRGLRSRLRPSPSPSASATRSSSPLRSQRSLRPTSFRFLLLFWVPGYGVLMIPESTQLRKLNRSKRSEQRRDFLSLSAPFAPVKCLALVSAGTVFAAMPESTLRTAWQASLELNHG